MAEKSGSIYSKYSNPRVDEGWGIRIDWEQLDDSYNVKAVVYFELRKHWSDLILTQNRSGKLTINGREFNLSLSAANYGPAVMDIKLGEGTVNVGSAKSITISATFDVEWNLRGYNVRQFRASGTVSLKEIIQRPNNPTNVTARLNNSNFTTINISWSHSTSSLRPATEYQIREQYQTYSSGGWGSWSGYTNLTSNKGNPPSRSKTRTGRTKGRRYRYEVRAINKAGASDWVRSDAVLVPAAPNKPNLTLSLDSSNETTVVATWTITTAANRPIENFQLQRRVRGTSTWTTVSSNIASSSRSYSNTGRTRGETYQYRIRAVGPYESGSYSDIKSIRIPYLAPNKPENLTVTRIAHNEFRLTWSQTTSSSRPVAQYDIYRRETNGTQTENWSNWTKIDTINYSSSHSYVDRTVQIGKTYQYYIVARNEDRSTASDESNILTNPAGIPVYDGVSWQIRPVYVYDGSNWIHRAVFVYDGANWRWRA